MPRHRLLRRLRRELEEFLQFSKQTLDSAFATITIRCKWLWTQPERHFRGVDALPLPTSTFPFCSGICTRRPDDYSEPPVFPVITPPNSWIRFFSLQRSEMKTFLLNSNGGFILYGGLSRINLEQSTLRRRVFSSECCQSKDVLINPSFINSELLFLPEGWDSCCGNLCGRLRAGSHQNPTAQTQTQTQARLFFQQQTGWKPAGCCCK